MQTLLRKFEIEEDSLDGRSDEIITLISLQYLPIQSSQTHQHTRCVPYNAR